MAASSDTIDTAVPMATGTAPVKSLAAKSALSTIGLVLNNGVCRSNHTLFVVASAGVTGGVVTLRASMDNVNWVSTSVNVTVTSAGVFQGTLTGAAYLYLQAFISLGITGGGTVDAWVGSAG